MKGKALIITETRGKTAADYIAKGEFDFIVCPGGPLKPLKKGCYAISQAAYEDAKSGKYGCHRYNDATCMAYEIGQETGKPAYMLYPMSSDELLQIKRVTSNAKVPKFSRYHALEHHAALMELSAETGMNIGDMNVIVAYVDDLVSVSAMLRGAAVDVNDCIGGEGPMGLTSSGDVPVSQLAAYYLNSGKSFDEMADTLFNKSGIAQHGDFADMAALDAAAAESADVKLACDAVAYQTAKWIGYATLALEGKVDYIVFTGKAIESAAICNALATRIKNIAPIKIYTDLDLEGKMAALAALLGTNALPVYDY